MTAPNDTTKFELAFLVSAAAAGLQHARGPRETRFPGV